MIVATYLSTYIPCGTTLHFTEKIRICLHDSLQVAQAGVLVSNNNLPTEVEQMPLAAD